MRVKDPTDEDEVRRALRAVWASVWLWGAFEEREFYRIDHRAVGMAILVQAVDVEFLVEAPSRKVLIVQARPYPLSWSGDRKWKWAF